MTITKKWLLAAGWITFIFTWIALFANIANDWFTRQWISPLSIIMLIILGGGTVIQLLRREPIISTEGMTNRFLVTLCLVLIICIIILGRIVLSFLG